MSILLKRGTRSAIDDQAIKGLLQSGEPLFISDESRLAIATSGFGYQAMMKQGEVTQYTPPVLPGVSGTLVERSTLTTNYIANIASTEFVNNVTVNSTPGRLTVNTAGIYIVHVQLLVSTAGYSCYLLIRKNGVNIAHAYSNDDTTYDLVNTVVISLQANDYIDFYFNGSTTYAWGSQHSHFFLHRIG